MILAVHIGEQVVVCPADRCEEAESSGLGSRFFLRNFLAYLRSRGEDPATIEGMILLFGKAKFSLSRQAATVLNTLAFVYGIKIAGVHAPVLNVQSISRGLSALRRARQGIPALPRYAAAPHITQSKKHP